MALIEHARAKMDRMMEHGRVVVFATHALGLLPKICERTIRLDHGSVVLDGRTTDVVSDYLDDVRQGRT